MQKGETSVITMIPDKNEALYEARDSSSVWRTPVVPSLTSSKRKKNENNDFLSCPHPPQQENHKPISNKRPIPFFPLDEKDDEPRIVRSLERASLQPRFNNAYPTSPFVADFQEPFSEHVRWCHEETILACPKIPLRGDCDLTRAPSHILFMKQQRHRRRGFSL